MRERYLLTMSNLIPTPRTDKNGRIVVRHMKSDAAGTVSKKLSTVPPLGTGASSTGLTNEELSALIDPEGMIPEGISIYLDMLRKDNPTTLPIISELLTTGNETGKKLALRKFSIMLNDIANSYQANPRKWVRGYSPQQGSPRLESEVAKNWAIGNVAEELGIGMSSDREYQNLNGPATNTDYVQHGGAFNSAAKTTAYWRGTIAFNQTTIRWRDEDKKKVHAFVLWAGEQGNLQAIIDVASERKTLDVDTLTGVLAERDSSSPVRDGVL